jgi:hypothetical protein
VIRITWLGIRINKVLTRVECSIEAVKGRFSQPYDLIGFQSFLRDIRGAMFLSLCRTIGTAINNQALKLQEVVNHSYITMGVDMHIME